LRTSVVERIALRVRAQPEIADATPLQLAVGAVARAPSVIVFGIDSNGSVGSRLVLAAQPPVNSRAISLIVCSEVAGVFDAVYG
jgi:hypothetical protein